MAVQSGLCRTWSETPKTGFLRTRLILDPSNSTLYGKLAVCRGKVYIVFLIYAFFMLYNLDYRRFERVSTFCVSMHDFSSKTLSSNMTTRRIRLLVEKNGQVRHLVDFIFNRSTTPGRKRNRPSVRLCFFRNKYQFFVPGIGHYKNPIGLLD